jgi:hypothetical protein
MTTTRTRSLIQTLTRVLAILSAIVVLFTLRACFVRPQTNFAGEHFNRGQNAAWLGVEWSMEPHLDAEIAALAADLRDHQIDTIFVYVSYLKSNGEFNPTYDYAHDFVAVMNKIAPEIEVQAWLGVPTLVPPGTPGGSGYIDLADEAVQNKIAEFSRLVVQDFRFDGIHLDAEPVVTGDPALLRVLEKIRAAIGVQSRLSIAGREITPFLPEADLIVNRWFTWRGDYYREVARRVDQVAVMAYDSHAPFGFWYEQWVRHQVINLTNSLRGTTAEILIGIPTSEEYSSSHDPAVENMQTGLTGLLAGLNDLDAQPERISGVAIYPYWDTSEDEWQTYSKLWLGQTE